MPMVRLSSSAGWRFPNVELDEFVVMPNHIHGILVLGTDGVDNPEGKACLAPTIFEPHAGVAKFGKLMAGSLGAVIGSFKSAVSKQINQWRNMSGAAIWQRGYYEHIVRDENELHRIRQYILDNPLKWSTDAENSTVTR